MSQDLTNFSIYALLTGCFIASSVRVQRCGAVRCYNTTKIHDHGIIKFVENSQIYKKKQQNFDVSYMVAVLKRTRRSQVQQAQ